MTTMHRALLGVTGAMMICWSCREGWNEPHPVTPEPGLPCGRVYHQCPVTGGCCSHEERCGVEGHACGLGDCCFVGETMGGARQKRKQLTPDEARKIAP